VTAQTAAARCEDCQHCHAVKPEMERWYCDAGVGHGGSILRGSGAVSQELTRLRECVWFASRHATETPAAG